MLGVGACLRTPGLPGARGSIPVELFRTEFDAVRKLGLQATIHCGQKNQIDLTGKNSFLGPDKTGSLTPGKRADLIMVRTTDINMAPVGDPITPSCFKASHVPSWQRRPR